VSKIEDEIGFAKIDFEAQLLALETIDDYSALTGVQLLSEFEVYYRLLSRCSQLWKDNDSKPGIIGTIAQELLSLEDACNELAPWENNKLSRSDWRMTVEDTAETWRNGCALHIGPKEKESDESDFFSSPSKRPRLSLDSVGSPKRSAGPSLSFDHVLSVFRVSYFSLYILVCIPLNITDNHCISKGPIT